MLALSVCVCRRRRRSATAVLWRRQALGSSQRIAANDRLSGASIRPRWLQREACEAPTRGRRESETNITSPVPTDSRNCPATVVRYVASWRASSHSNARKPITGSSATAVSRFAVTEAMGPPGASGGRWAASAASARIRSDPSSAAKASSAKASISCAGTALVIHGARI